MGRGGAGRHHSPPARREVELFQKKPSRERATEGECRRSSFPPLPDHAMLGSQQSREASKSFWNTQMLKDVERRLSHGSEEGDSEHRLPPVNTRQATETRPSPLASTTPLHLPKTPGLLVHPPRKTSLTGSKPTLTGLYAMDTSYKHRKSPPELSTLVQA